MEDEDQTQNQGENGAINNNATNINQNEQTFDEILEKNKGYQAEFDRRINQALQTREKKLKEQWKLEQDSAKTEAEKLAQMTEKQKFEYQMKKQEEKNKELERKLNARDLRDEGLKIATTKETAFDPEFLNLFSFENMTADELQTKTKLIKAIQDRIVEKTISEWSKEKNPYNPKSNNPGTNNQVSETFKND